MERIKSSIKCRYCSHFEEGSNKCHLYYMFDSSFYKADGTGADADFIKFTSPDDRCDKFALPAMEVIVRSREPRNGAMFHERPDGSYIVSLSDVPELQDELFPPENEGCGGCYIATCVYGSYDCPQVWTLRRFRDQTLAATWFGRAFIRVYYAVSPSLVKWFGDTVWFEKIWRGRLDRLVGKLHDKGVEDSPYQDRVF